MWTMTFRCVVTGTDLPSVPTSVPVQHSERAQRDPTTRNSDSAGQFFVQGVLVSHVEQPVPVPLATLADGRDGFLDSRVGLGASHAQIVERAEHVIVPERGKGELRPRRLDYVAGRQPSEQTTLEKILLRGRPSVRHRRCGT